LAFIARNKPDFLGINFYAPAVVKGEDSAMSLKWLDNNPDAIKSNVGPVMPEYLYKMLVRLKKEYGNPTVYITENGTGFVGEDVVKMEK
jgi:beta-glucosidase